MSDEAPQVYRRFREEEDPKGDLAWAARMMRKSVCASEDAQSDIDRAFKLSLEEKILWRLIKIPRRYSELEAAGILSTTEARRFFRGLFTAEVLELSDEKEGRPIVPIELKRVKQKLTGKGAVTVSSGGKLRGRVYRPEIGITSKRAPVRAKREASAGRKRSAPKKSKKPKQQDDEDDLDMSTLSRDERALFSEILNAHKAARTQNYYEFIGIEKDAGPSGIKAAYMRLARDWHPDRVAGTNLEGHEATCKRLDELFKKLQEVNSVLSKEEERAEYDIKLAADPTAGASSDARRVRRPDEARVLSKKADHLLKAKQYGQAEQSYRVALELDRESTEAQLGVAWAIFLNPARTEEERTRMAHEKLEPLVKERKLAEAAYRMAMIARIQNNTADQEHWIKITLRMNPRHREAMQEKRLFDRRQEAGRADATTQKSAKKGAQKGGLFKKRKR